jgi:hypothetical protein
MCCVDNVLKLVKLFVKMKVGYQSMNHYAPQPSQIFLKIQICELVLPQPPMHGCPDLGQAAGRKVVGSVHKIVRFNVWAAMEW